MEAILMLLPLFLLCSGDTVEVMEQKVQAKRLDVPLTVNCSQSGLQAGDTVMKWTLNDNTTAMESTGGISLHDNGGMLVIENMRWSSYGIYLCHVTRRNREQVVYVTEVQTPDQDLWGLYKNNTIVGCVAAAVLLFLLTLVCLVYHFRWRPEEASREGYDITAAGRGYDLSSGRGYASNGGSDHHNEAYDFEEGVADNNGNDPGVYLTKIYDTKM